MLGPLKRAAYGVLAIGLVAGCAGTKLVWYRPIASQDKAVCLTFDDGPNGAATEAVLAVLRRHQVQATFFLIGKNVEREPALARRIVQEGHLIGSHSYGHHPLLAFQSRERIKEDLERANHIIVEATEVHPRYFRPPDGLMTDRLEQICRELGLVPVGVHVFVYGVVASNPTKLARRILKQVRKGPGIVVLHDGFGTSRAPSRTVVSQALEQIIPELTSQGYRWVTLDAFFALSGEEEEKR